MPGYYDKSEIRFIIFSTELNLWHVFPDQSSFWDRFSSSSHSEKSMAGYKAPPWL